MTHIIQSPEVDQIIRTALEEKEGRINSFVVEKIILHSEHSIIAALSYIPAGETATRKVKRAFLKEGDTWTVLAEMKR